MAVRNSAFQSDFAKVDAYANTRADYDELPELTDSDVARAGVHEGGKPVRRDRPKLEELEERVANRLND